MEEISTRPFVLSLILCVEVYFTCFRRILISKVYTKRKSTKDWQPNRQLQNTEKVKSETLKVSTARKYSSNLNSWKQQFTSNINKPNLPELEDESPFRLSQNHKECNPNRVTPEYPIEYLQSPSHALKFSPRHRKKYIHALIQNNNARSAHTQAYMHMVETERERVSTSDPFSKDRIADRMLTTMQRIATRAVMTLKHLQTTRKGSVLTLSLVVVVPEDSLPKLSSSPSLAIFLSFLSSYKRKKWKQTRYQKNLSSPFSRFVDHFVVTDSTASGFFVNSRKRDSSPAIQGTSLRMTRGRQKKG